MIPINQHLITAECMTRIWEILIQLMSYLIFLIFIFHYAIDLCTTVKIFFKINSKQIENVSF